MRCRPNRHACKYAYTLQVYQLEQRTEVAEGAEMQTQKTWTISICERCELRAWRFMCIVHGKYFRFLCNHRVAIIYLKHDLEYGRNFEQIPGVQGFGPCNIDIIPQHSAQVSDADFKLVLNDLPVSNKSYV